MAIDQGPEDGDRQGRDDRRQIMPQAAGKAGFGQGVLQHSESKKRAEGHLLQHERPF